MCVFCEAQNWKESSDGACCWAEWPQWYSCCKGISVSLLLPFTQICVSSLGLFLESSLDCLPDFWFPASSHPLITEKMDVNGLRTSKMGMGCGSAGSDVCLRLCSLIVWGERVLWSFGEGEFCLLSTYFLTNHWPVALGESDVWWLHKHQSLRARCSACCAFCFKTVLSLRLRNIFSVFWGYQFLHQ